MKKINEEMPEIHSHLEGNELINGEAFYGYFFTLLMEYTPTPFT